MSTKKFFWQESQPGRRAGLSASNYRLQSLLIQVGTNDVSKEKMKPPKGAETKVEKLKPENEASLLAPPAETDSDSESDSKSANIESTFFKSKLDEVKGIPSSKQSLRQHSASRHTTRASATRPSLSAPRSSQEHSSQSSSSHKRKSEDDDKVFGAAIRKRTVFDGSSTKRAKPKTQYGGLAKPQRSISSKSPRKSVKAQPKKFVQPNASFSSDEDIPRTPAHSTPKKSFQPVFTPGCSPEKPKYSAPKQKFIVHEMSDMEDSPMRELDENMSQFNAPSLPNSPINHELSNYQPLFEDSGLKRGSSPRDSPEKPLDIFQRLKLKFPNDVSCMLSEDVAQATAQSSFDADDVLAPHLARCPMCRKPVTKQFLKQQGFMNIRQQERFCNSHQKDTALNEWNEKGYPQIDWDGLDSRIAQHHTFIENLIRGQDSHYRNLLDDIVEAGTERNLLKSKGNLTPGYYGSRGLRVISENIMLKFTKLLKERAVQDKVIMARSVTAFLQMVLVPEVTTLLIMEDMSIEEAEARDVLAESAVLGDIVHEEILDVVARPKEDDSGEDEDSDMYD